jgi:SAM-dependent methyltransferase
VVVIGDAYGAAMTAAFGGDPRGIASVERSDGRLMLDIGIDYLAPARRWVPEERAAIRRARGRVLDVGCGAGRVALHLQERGHEVVAIDVSPGAVALSRERGVLDARELPASQVRAADGPFDTIVMYGNNLGLLRDARHATWLLRRFASATSPGALLLGGTLDPYRTEDPSHLAYQAENRRRGRMAGQIRMRIRFNELATPWFDYLFVSKDELASLVDGTGWQLADTIEDRSAQYVAVLERV